MKEFSVVQNKTDYLHERKGRKKPIVALKTKCYHSATHQRTCTNKETFS